MIKDISVFLLLAIEFGSPVLLASSLIFYALFFLFKNDRQTMSINILTIAAVIAYFSFMQSLLMAGASLSTSISISTSPTGFFNGDDYTHYLNVFFINMFILILSFFEIVSIKSFMQNNQVRSYNERLHP